MLTVLVFVVAVAVGAVLGLFTFVQITTLKNAEQKTAIDIMKVVVGVILLVIGAIIAYRIPSYAIWGYMIGALMAFAPSIRTQLDLHPETDEEQEG